MLTETRGTIVMNSLFDGYSSSIHQGEITAAADRCAVIADRQGPFHDLLVNGLQEQPGQFSFSGLTWMFTRAWLWANISREQRGLNVKGRCAKRS